MSLRGVRESTDRRESFIGAFSVDEDGGATWLVVTPGGICSFFISETDPIDETFGVDASVSFGAITCSLAAC